MDEFTLGIVGFLLVATLISAVEYYRQLRRAKREYEEARELVDDVVLSFSRQFKREGERLELLAYRVEAAGSRGDKAYDMLGDIEKRMSAVEAKVVVDSENSEKLAVQMAEVDNRTRQVVASQETVAARVASLEQRAGQLPVIPEGSLEAVIPIRRDRALAQLTGTEISVLEMLASDGPRTAPEIKERVRLSREHTARLMKKLYEEGYLERETDKIPFKYSVKKEMEKILKRADNQAT